MYDASGTALLDVKGIGVVAIAFHHEPAEKGQGRLAPGGKTRQVGMHARGSLAHLYRGSMDVAAEFLASVQNAEIKEYLGVEQCIGLWITDPVTEGLNPLGRCHPPCGRHGHHLPRAQHLSCLRKAFTHERGEAFEILAMGCGIVVIRQNQSIVLIRSQGHLAAALGTDGDEGIIHRWRAKLFLCQGA